MRRNVGFLLAGLALLLAACGSSPAATSPPTKAVSAAFPLKVRSGDGTVSIPSRPTRILCLTPSGTQMLYAIGAGKQVVGVDKYSTYPANAPRTKFTGYETSAEDYLGLKPDLVILSFSTGTLVSQLQKLGIPTLLIPPAASVGGTRAELVELGRATGHLPAAEAVGSQLSRYLRAQVKRAGGRGRGKSFYIELDQTYYTATSRTFAGQLFSQFGMRDIADAASRASSGYPQLSSEYVLKANPDYVFLADTVCCHQSAASFAARPGFSGLKAVRDHHVIGVNDSVASEWGPHSLEVFVGVIARALAGKGA